MRKDITTLIDDIKYQSDSLTDLDRLPVIQLNVILAKMNMLTRKTTILLHYVELEGEKQKILRQDSQKTGIVDDTQTVAAEIESTPPVEAIGESKPIESEPVKSEIKEEKKKVGNVEDQLKQIAIVDLTAAIGINEKYLFASELFGGNIEEYIKAIQTLNTFERWDEAVLFLDDLAEKHKWDIESELVISLRNLVERRYYQL